MRWTTIFLSLLAGAGLAGCASSSECEASAYPRPFGERFVTFGHQIAGIDDTLARDWNLHTHYLADQWDRVSSRQALAFRQTGHAIADAFPALGRDATNHWKWLSQTVSSWGQRTARDTQCFPVRFWEGLKAIQ